MNPFLPKVMGFITAMVTVTRTTRVRRCHQGTRSRAAGWDIRYSHQCKGRWPLQEVTIATDQESMPHILHSFLFQWESLLPTSHPYHSIWGRDRELVFSFIQGCWTRQLMWGFPPQEGAVLDLGRRV